MLSYVNWKSKIKANAVGLPEIFLIALCQPKKRLNVLHQTALHSDIRDLMFNSNITASMTTKVIFAGCIFINRCLVLCCQVCEAIMLSLNVNSVIHCLIFQIKLNSNKITFYSLFLYIFWLMRSVGQLNCHSHCSVVYILTPRICYSCSSSS